MGQSKESTMKSFAFVCLFAAAYAAPTADADAEADPALLYSSLGYGFHHPYTYGAYAPYAVPAVHSAAVKSVVETPRRGEDHCARRPRGVQRCPSRRYRRPRRLQHRRPCRRPVVHTAGYHANSGGAVHIVKRDADADADADAAYYYSGYHHPYAYSGFRRFYGGFPYTAYNRGYFGGYYY